MAFLSFGDTLTLQNGRKIPCVGFGTWRLPDEEATARGILYALTHGYRHIDTAACYHNEACVGRAIRESGIDRRELFVCSKVWNTDRGYQSAKNACYASLERLGMEYLDLYLIHWPASEKQFPGTAGTINADTWRALEELYDEGVVKSIGVSNFLPHHLLRLEETARILPMVDQIEFHPGYAQIEAARWCQERNIVVEAWSPLGNGEVLQHPTIVRLAEKYGVTSAQLCLRWVIQHDVLPLTKSLQKTHIVENQNLFSFAISDDDMAELDRLPPCGGLCNHPDEIDY